ncbi:MAG: hypothetical protein RIN63_14250 [Tissierella sp.]|nr:hypothetical protein [Tissierella sp.]
MSKNQATKLKKKDKAPDSLGKLSDSLQGILKETEIIESILDGTDEEVKKAELEKAKEQEKVKLEGNMGEKKEGGNSSSKQGSSQSSNQSTDTNKKGEKKPKDKEEKLLSTWESLNKKIEETHKKWNDYESEGIKKGINQNSTQKFKDSINALTKSVEEKNILGIYDYTSQSMVNLAPILEVYKDEIWGEINRVKSAVYKSYAKAIVGKYEEAQEQLKNLEEVANKTRLKIEDDNKKIQSLEKVNLSIEAMRQSLEEKSITLTRIKKDIVIKNLDELGK